MSTERLPTYVSNERLEDLIAKGNPTFSEAHDMAVEIIVRRRAEAKLATIAMPVEALEAGWNACRKSLYAVCEDVAEQADKIKTAASRDDASEYEKGHVIGYHAGTCYAAKSIASGFNSMSAMDDDNLRAAALSERDASQVGMKALEENDVWLLASAAENLRGGGSYPRDSDEAVSIRFRIAGKLDELQKRILAALDNDKEQRNG